MAYTLMFYVYLVFFPIFLFFQYDFHFDVEYKQAGSADDKTDGEIPLARKSGSTDLSTMPCSHDSDPSKGKEGSCHPQEQPPTLRWISFTVSWHPPPWGSVARGVLYAAVPTVVVYLAFALAMSILEEATAFL